MPYSINPLNQSFPEEGKKYLLDANVWKFILSLPQNLTAEELVYVNFFDAIINLSSNPLCKDKPSIYINGLIISEVYNAHMRSHWDAYNLTIANDIKFKDYRSTEDFKKNLSNIKSDFKAYLPYLEIGIDLVHSPDKILFEIPSFSDFNDHYYFKIAQSNGFTIITNDGDFKYSDIDILTMRPQLLALR
jgi:predicted nucleic acid-binding protein